ncbi:C40 family peptidase [Nocardioides terrisoli]|uniref:C40 family peptidase n=1 Tax=Nocardioides terrisoli TaxID=3388267 RepID=UPI00287B7937|nr:C40 family peptidase [Nocardioides marmorisolisilvae]
MRKNARTGLAAAVTLASVLGLGGVAVADGNGGYPTQQQVDNARRDVAAKKGDVASIRSELTRAQARAQAADQRAEIASEAYNGAMWRLSVARKEAKAAHAAALKARQRVNAQRDEIAQLVVQSYQDGTSLNSVTAMLGAGGPEEIMSRTGVVGMAGDSMQADYDRFTRLSAEAKKAQQHADATARNQAEIAAKARAARAAAGASAQQAEAVAHQVAARRATLIEALAKAEHTSVALANQRQQALEEIARRKAEAKARREAAAAAAKARAEAEARQRAQEKADREKAAQDGQSASSGSGPSSSPDPSPSSPPAVSSSGAAAAIRFAEAQLGEPYQWAAAGPNSWDCSGLTMMAWRAGGIYLPHFSGAQYDAGTPISVSDARPGDLLFWSYNGMPSGIHHVALYLGGGRFIEAPHTGAYVRYNSIYDWYPNFAVRL